MSYSCTNCEEINPDSAIYCPHCGTQQESSSHTLMGISEIPAIIEMPDSDTLPGLPTAEIKRKTIEIAPELEVAVPEFNSELFEHLDDNLELDFDAPKRPVSAYIVMGFAAVAMVGALIAGGIVIANATPDEPVAEPASPVAEVTAPAEVEPEPEVVKPRIDPAAFAVKEESKPKKHKVVKYQEQPLVPVFTSRGSRYKSVDKRAESVHLRLKHVAELESAKEKPAPDTFKAQRSGSVYEVVYARGDGSPFRIVDITAQDVKAWQKVHGKTSKSILANMVADKLNQSFASPPEPNS